MKNCVKKAIKLIKRKNKKLRKGEFANYTGSFTNTRIVINESLISGLKDFK